MRGTVGERKSRQKIESGTGHNENGSRARKLPACMEGTDEIDRDLQRFESFA